MPTTVTGSALLAAQGLILLIGTPETIAGEMIAIAEQGYQGIALSFVNDTQELPYFCDRVLPLLRQAGYRGRWIGSMQRGLISPLRGRRASCACERACPRASAWKTQRGGLPPRKENPLSCDF